MLWVCATNSGLFQGFKSHSALHFQSNMSQCSTRALDLGVTARSRVKHWKWNENRLWKLCSEYRHVLGEEHSSLIQVPVVYKQFELNLLPLKGQPCTFSNNFIFYRTWKDEHFYAKQVVFVPAFSASTSLPTAASTSWFWTRISTSVISIPWGRTTIALQCIIFSIPCHRFARIVQKRGELFYIDMSPFFCTITSKENGFECLSFCIQYPTVIIWQIFRLTWMKVPT